MDLSKSYILATNLERLDFVIGEAKGGSTDGMELLVMKIDEWCQDGKVIPEQKIVFSRKSAEKTVKALVSWLALDDDDRQRMEEEEEENQR